MDIDLLLHFYAYCAYISAAAAILTFVTSILFFTQGQPFGTINDISAVIQVLFMVPLAVMFFQLLPSGIRVPGLLIALAGIVGMLIVIYGQSLLVFKRIDFEGSLKYFPAGAVIGIWLVLVCSLALGCGQLPTLPAWIGMLAGAGYIVTVAGFLKGGRQNVLFYIGGLILGISFPIWGIWLGSLLLSGIIG